MLYQKAFGGGTKKPATFTETVRLPAGKEPFILNLVNGTTNGEHRLSSATVQFNGQLIVGPGDLGKEIQAVNRGITPAGENQLSLTVRGTTESFVLIRILGGIASRGELPPPPERNETQANEDFSLWSLNLGDSVALWFTPYRGTALYVLSVAPAPGGPWQEIQHLDAAFLSPNYSTVDLSDDADTGEPRGQTGDFRESTIYYRMLALDKTGKILKAYSVVAVPPYINERPSPAVNNESANSPKEVDEGVAVLFEAASVCGSPCVQNQPFISDSVLTDVNTMTLDQIRELLRQRNSFLQGDANHQIADVDETLIDPGQIIYDAAQDNQINPQILIATIQKESSAIASPTRLPDAKLVLIAGYGDPSTIQRQITKAAEQVRRDYNRVSSGGQTLGAWRTGQEHGTSDGKTVCPANHAMTALWQYNPVVGKRWGGTGGGISLFFKLYYETFLFGAKPLLCGVYSYSAFAPTGDVQTTRPKISVQVTTGKTCNSIYKLFLDDGQVASGTLPAGGGSVTYTVPKDLTYDRHTARIQVDSTECSIRSTETWKFRVIEGKKIAMVIDDTGSMYDDIDAVRVALSNFISSQTSQSNSPGIEWTLITFKDDVSIRGTTTDAETIQDMVANLYASGGDDCPEESLGALNTALYLIGDGEETKDIILATDASPQGGIGNVAATIAALQAGGIRVHTLLTGDCVFAATATSAADSSAKGFNSYDGTLSARQVFAQISAATDGLFSFLPGASVEDLTASLGKIFEATGGGSSADTNPPELFMEVSPSIIGPPNHQMVEIAPILTVADDIDPNPAVKLLSIISSEPADGQGSGATEDDIIVTGDGRIFVRAERSGKGNNRTYTITYRAVDASGNSTTASADVLVLHDRR